MKKKVFYLLPIFLFIFLFSGCKSESQSFSNAIMFGITIKSDGAISQTISFPTQIKEMDLSDEEKSQYIEELTLEIKSKLFFPYYYNFYTISALSEKTRYKIGGENTSYSQPEYSEKDQTISFSFNFSDNEVWEFYHPKTEESEGMKIKKTLFMNYGESESRFIFNEKFTSSSGETTLGNHFYTILSTVQQKHSNKDFEKPSFAYVYSHFSNKLHTNADIHQFSNGQYEHVWIENFDQLSEEKNIKITLYSPNKAVWYGAALIGTILIMTIVWFVHHCKNVKAYRKEKI